jgi:tetratricopeptide (TPR) repeat protein
MTEEQLTFGDAKIVEILNTVFQLFKEGDFPGSVELLSKALEIDLAYPGLSATFQCANFWNERRDRDAASKDPFQKGEILLAQWKLFQVFLERLPDVPERCLYALKQHVFTSALRHFNRIAETEEAGDADLLFRIGRCHKGLGNYDAATEAMEKANRRRPEDPGILAELADCYSLVNEVRAAKVFFREAFFLDPQAPELASLESPMIQRLAARVRRMGIAEPEVPEWIPVYGTVYGVFNVKRQMKPLELGKLKQSIYALEKEAGRPGSPPALVPRLINRYFWLIDHYLGSGEEKEKVEEVLERIRDLHPEVYREYIN